MNPHQFVHQHQILNDLEKVFRDHSTKATGWTQTTYEDHPGTFRDRPNAVTGTETDADSKRFRLQEIV